MSAPVAASDAPAEPPSTLVGSLPAGTRLHEYVIERVLGHGGFGITYLAHDTNLDKKVAIKEYLPNDLAARAPDSTVTVRSPESREAFQWGLESFIKEARVLGKFSHASLIQVHRYFEANDTAYFVMDYAQGVTLAAVMRTEGALSEERLRRILFPILNGLEEVHRLGVLHRDIKPDNIILREGSLPVLIDFGAARQTLSTMTRSVMSVLTAGYAPIEQYATSGNQGPWTDIYAIGAVAYRALSGQKPVDAINRIRNDPMVPASSLGRGRYADSFLAAIDWALAVNPEDRPSSVAEFKRALDGQLTPPLPAQGAATPRHAAARPPWRPVDEGDGPTTIRRKREESTKGSRWAVGAGILAGTLVLGLVATSVLMRSRPPAPAATEPASSAAAEPTPNPAAPVQADTAPPAGPASPSSKTAPASPSAQTASPTAPAATAPQRAARTAEAPAQQAPAPVATAPPQHAAAPAIPAAAAPAPAAKPQEPAASPAARPAPASIATLAPLSVFQDCPQCPRMIALPAGSFQMGATPADNGNAWEGPAHAVTLARPFAIGRHEVTVREWQACVRAAACDAADAGPVTGDAAQAPAVNVSWSQAQAYTTWLTRETGRRYRLPTEAEWEYAIRARTTTARYWAGDRTKQCRYGNGADQSALTRDPKLPAVECDDGFPVLAPVGSFEANAFGLLDMAGNAWEWTQDCWRESYQGAPADGRALELPTCERRVIRGGSWRARANSLRSFGRGHSPPETRSEDLGLRVAAE